MSSEDVPQLPVVASENVPTANRESNTLSPENSQLTERNVHPDGIAEHTPESDAREMRKDSIETENPEVPVIEEKSSDPSVVKQHHILDKTKHTTTASPKTQRQKSDKIYNSNADKPPVPKNSPAKAKQLAKTRSPEKANPPGKKSAKKPGIPASSRVPAHAHPVARAHPASNAHQQTVHEFVRRRSMAKKHDSPGQTTPRDNGSRSRQFGSASLPGSQNPSPQPHEAGLTLSSWSTVDKQ
eukprot:767017_1